MQQAKDYAEVLGLKFALATNGAEIVEFDFFTGQERLRADFPSPDELWARYRAGHNLPDQAAEQLLTPSHAGAFSHPIPATRQTQWVRRRRSSGQ